MRCTLPRMSGHSWTREPLLHFAVLGVVVFGLFARFGHEPPQRQEIRVSAATLARIEAQQARRLGRPPNPAELDGALGVWADEQILYREALSLGLDRGDSIVRRRLTQKMHFMLEESAEVPEPSEAALEGWIAEHAERFERAPRVALTQIFVASSSRSVPEAKLVEIEGALAEGADPVTLGEAFPLGQELGAKTGAELNRSFGPGFGQAAVELPDLGWHRVRSLYGWHLVHVEERVAGELAGVDEVRAEAREGLLREGRSAAEAREMDELRERYEVVIEGRDD